ncbi:MAG: hypothetical protein IKM70_01495, partial [Firmicutes bacterium]|nr:hypothetical protein [Bacillota bacterium]
MVQQKLGDRLKALNNGGTAPQSETGSDFAKQLQQGTQKVQAQQAGASGFGLGDRLKAAAAKNQQTQRPEAALGAAAREDDAARYGLIPDPEDKPAGWIDPEAKRKSTAEWGEFGSFAHANPGKTAKYAGKEIVGGAADTIEGVGKMVKAISAEDRPLTEEEKLERGLLEDPEDQLISEALRREQAALAAKTDERMAGWKSQLDADRAMLREETGAPQAASDALSQLGQLGVLGAAGALTGAGGVMGLMSASIYGHSFEDAMQDEGMIRGRAHAYAAVNAVAQGLIEGFGGVGGKAVVGSVLQDIFSEALEEGVAYGLEVALQNFILERDVPFSLREAAYQSMMGAIGGGVFGVGARVAGRIVTPRMAADAAHLEEVLQEVGAQLEMEAAEAAAEPAAVPIEAAQAAADESAQLMQLAMEMQAATEAAENGVSDNSAAPAAEEAP